MSLRMVLLVLLSTTVAGCAGWDGSSPLTQLPLPDPAQLHCCWQSQEQVRVTRANTAMELVTAVAVTADGLTVVVFDALGRRLVTLVHRGGGVHTLTAPPEWSEALSHQLLLAIYLHHLAPAQWRFEQPGWVVAEDKGVKSLQYRKQELVRLRYEHQNASDNLPRHIEYVGRDIHLDVQTLTRTEL